ncbi:hypothetical protein [Aeromicrobium sp. 9AM]|uniref:hypothetical protein n=1 Tax=Aeromicrobium sp. 9AM TaxID=2653126 RepID=UPI0012F1FF10|nr:hypothetical protein [Aeromicrobium sp. 9AM]VXB81769.1 conserved hypothetical protein [Aeromicrobium sp. 9AM]
MVAAFMLSVGDIWIPLTGVQRGATRASDRATGSFVTLGGTRYVQRARRAPRTWSLAYAAKDPQAIAWLAHAANGDAGEVWLLDRMAAQANMLDPRTTAGRLNGQPSIATALGVPMQTFGVETAFTRRVRAGQWYHLSGWTTRGSGAEIGTLTVGAETPVSVIAPTGSGARRWSVAFNPDADATVTFAITSAAKTTALRLTESSVDQYEWIPGHNTPCRVSVSDPDGVLSLYRPGSPPLSDYTVTLQEVG